MLKKELNLNLKLKSLLLGVILTDGWLELGKGARNYRVGFSQGTKHYDVLQAFVKEMGLFITATPKESLKSAPVAGNPKQRTSRKYAVKSIRSIRHFELTKFASNFICTKSGSKTVPNTNFLLIHLNWYSFAWIIMCDGAAHSPGVSQGIKLHLQNFSYSELSRLCLCLYHKLGVQCWPAVHGYDANRNVTYYHVRISGRSLRQIRKNVMVYMLNSTTNRVPPLLENGGSPKPNRHWLAWYKLQKKRLKLSD